MHVFNLRSKDVTVPCCVLCVEAVDISFPRNARRLIVYMCVCMCVYSCACLFVHGFVCFLACLCNCEARRHEISYYTNTQEVRVRTRYPRYRDYTCTKEVLTGYSAYRTAWYTSTQRVCLYQVGFRIRCTCVGYLTINVQKGYAIYHTGGTSTARKQYIVRMIPGDTRFVWGVRI